MSFKYMILMIFILFAVAVAHQASLGADLDKAVNCRIIVYEKFYDGDGENLTTKLADMKGYATEVLNENYFIVDFTNDMFTKGLSERFNNYVHTVHVMDCGLDKLPGPSRPDSGRIEARFPGDSENY